ncbi:MAG TPA: VOC family protein [Vicinamibacterales bacterium]|nr:VOC family protein [Vicinamibacterales bacterium]
MRRAVLAPILAVLTIASGAAQTDGPRPGVTGVHHVALRISDAAAARTFYGGLLGLSEQAPPRQDRLAYAIGHRQHLLLEPGLPAEEEERLGHVALATPDVKAMAAWLETRGFEILRPADRCGDTTFQVRDPDGHDIEFVRADWPPAASPAPASHALSTRLLHAGVIVNDEARAHGFYRDALRFSEIWRGGRTPGVTQWVNMRVPDGTDYFEYMLVTSPPDRRQRGVLHHVCLVVPDIQTAWEETSRRSLRLGLTPSGPASIGVNGRWQLNLYDPDGTRVELMEPFTVR